jgi:hypothetical protein
MTHAEAVSHTTRPTSSPPTNDLRTLQVPQLGEVYFNMHHAYFTISEAFRSTYSFDADGRFLMGFINGLNYYRGLENVIMMKYFTEERRKVRRALATDEKHALLADVLARVAAIRAHLPPDMPQRICHWLDAILTWDFARLEAERERFNAIYKPITILPPDHYFAVVLQAAEGCSWNECTFCDFYRDRRFRIKSPAEFRQHVQQVKQFFGKAIALRKSLFLADANALIIPQARLLDLLQIIHEEFPIDVSRRGYGGDYALQGIYSFLDIFGAEKKTRQQYEELRDYGVRRIYIGLETGDDALFALLNKPGSPHECVEAVETIKAAGIDVGVIILAGAGGDRYYQQHVRNSIAAITHMPLDSGDIVYLSPLVVREEDAYAQQARALGLRILTPDEVMIQVDIIKAELKMSRPDRPRVTLYNIEEFLY